MAGLYIHIPFCKRKCRYCDFVSSPDYKYEDLYFIALIEEMRLYSALMQGRRFDTVFVGGGTPTSLKDGRLAAILNAARKFFSISEDAEITVEANPESSEEKKLKELYDAGVNRISFGLQSACSDELVAIGRLHSFEDFERAVGYAREIGFENINADVMHGLPMQTVGTYLKNLETVSGLGIPHISSYSLILEEGTPLYDDVISGKADLPDADDVADMEDAGFDILGNKGYIRYEISNFAIPGFECRHNLNYWDNGEYLGLGLNSHSALHLSGEWVRFNNTELMGEYIEKLGEGKLPVKNTEKIERREEMFETVMLGLRKCSGVSRADFKKRFGVDPVTYYAAAIAQLQLDGMIEINENSMYLNKRGLDYQNEALLKFMGQ